MFIFGDARTFRIIKEKDQIILKKQNVYLKMSEIEHLEHVGSGGGRQIPTIPRIFFENLEYGIKISES